MAAAMGEVLEQVLCMPSHGGPTGIVSVPNAGTASARKWQASLGYQEMRASPHGIYRTPHDLRVWSLQAGGRLSDTAGVWASYASADDNDRSRVWVLGGKSILIHPDTGPRAAVGASYHGWGNAFADGSSRGGGSWPDAKVLKAYTVVTGTFAGKGRLGPLGTAGVTHTRLDPDSGSSESLTRPFLGVQFFVTPVTLLGLEYRWKDGAFDAKPVFSASVRQWLPDQFTAELGTTNASPVGSGLGGQRLFLRLSRSM